MWRPRGRGLKAWQRSFCTWRAASSKSEERLIGDYPRLKAEYYQHRNPYLKYDDQQIKRNLGEPLHENYEVLDVWSPDRFDDVSDAAALRYVGITALVIAGVSVLMATFFAPTPPAVRRQYPHEGLYKALGGTPDTKEMFASRRDPDY